MAVVIVRNLPDETFRALRRRFDQSFGATQHSLAEPGRSRTWDLSGIIDLQ